MIKHTFEWSPTTGPCAGEWTTHHRTWKTPRGADAAASRFASDMEREGLVVEYRPKTIDPSHRGTPATILLPNGARL